MQQQHARAAGRDDEPRLISSLASSSVVAVLEVDGSGRIVAANAVLSRLLEERDPGALAGRDIAELVEPGGEPALLAPAHDAAPRRDIEVRLARRDGQVIVLRGDVLTFQDADGVARACGVFTDCTELDSLRRSMQHSARLEALASLVGGVAHDFNNLLTVLIGNLSLIAEEFRDRPETFAKLKSSRDAATRGSDLIKRLLGFAGAEELETSAIDPSDVIRKVVPLVGSALGKRVRLTTELDSGAGAVNANVALLESVIVNLAVNARDAIPGHGTVTISCSRLSLDERRASKRGLEPGDYMRIRVADDGAGIRPELLERVFEPFFSTKQDRGGTGLGLSMVRSFARQLGGRAAIRSEVGKGTAVSLWLPVTEDSTDTGSVQTRALATLPTGSERLVLLASEAGLAATVRQMLEVLGYTVVVCDDAAELDEAVSTAHTDMLILDGVVPGAADADARLAQLRQTQAELVSISLLEPGAAGGSAAHPAGAVLEKPFSLADLATLVRQTLDRRGA